MKRIFDLLGMNRFPNCQRIAAELARQIIPPHNAWVDGRYAVVHSSVVACQHHLAAALRGELRCETAGEDNLRTPRLVHAAYASAASGQVVAV